MKQPKSRQTRADSEELDKVISMARTAQDDLPVKVGARAGRKTSKHAAVGYTRTTIDLPESLHETLTREAFETKRSKREIIEELLEQRYSASAFRKYR